MHSIRVATILLLILSSLPLKATAQPSLEDYQYQRALYLSLTGDHLSSSELSSSLLSTPITDRDRLLLLLRLSDIKMQHKRDYPGFATLPLSADIPSQTRIMDSLYRMREYEEAISLGKLLNSGASSYFEGMSLLQLDRLDEAGSALAKVPPEDRFYPYAVISIAQIEVMKRNLKGAEGYLKGLLSSPSMKGDGLTDRVHILLGQVLFERGLFPEAVKEFSRVSSDSPLYGEAAIGQAWGLMRLGDYKGVIPILKGIKLYPPYDAVEREALVILGYCFLKLGWVEEAREHYQQILETVTLSEERLKEMIGERSIREQYASILLEGASSLTGEEQHYLSIIKGDPTTYDIIREYETLSILKTSFLRREREAMEIEASLENRIDGLEERLKKIEEDVIGSKKILLAIKGKERQSFYSETFDMDNITYFADNAFNYWKGTLGRDVDEETKKLLILIMKDWIERGRPECRSPLYICHILSFLDPNLGKIKEDPEEIREIVGVIERISGDLSNMRKGKNTRFEAMLPETRERVGKEIGKGRERVKRLRGIMEELNRNVQGIEAGSEKTLAGLDRHIMERLEKNRYELAEFKRSVAAWLEATKRELAREGEKQN